MTKEDVLKYAAKQVDYYKYKSQKYNLTQDTELIDFWQIILNALVRDI